VLSETRHVTINVGGTGDQRLRARVGAVAELSVVSSEIMEMVELLDGLNRYRFRTNADARAEWESARNIVAPPRPLGGTGTAQSAA
jgi:hypothetical protein